MAMIEFRLEGVPGVSRMIQAIYQDQMPFAVSRAANTVAKELQTAQRARMRGIYTVRNPLFVDRATKIKPFATKANPVATVQIAPPGGQRTMGLLTRHEKGAQKTGKEGGKVAVPFGARPSPQQIIERRLTFKRLQLRAYRTKKGKVQLRGRERSFLVKTPQGAFVFQRTGPGRQDVRLLYAATKASVPIPADLHFFETAAQVVAERLPGALYRAFMDAVRTAR